MPRTPAPFCTHSNSTTSPRGLLSQHDRQGPPPETNPQSHTGARAGAGARGEAREGGRRASWRRRSSPRPGRTGTAGRAGRAGARPQRPPQCTHGCPFSSAQPQLRAGWPAPQGPSQGSPARPPTSRQSGSGLRTGPRHRGQASKSRPARRRPRPRPSPSEACFSHPDTSPVNKQSPLQSLPKQTPQQSQGPGQDGTASAGRPPSPASAESRDPVISGGPRMCSILGPEGSDVTRCPSPGLQALPGGPTILFLPPTPVPRQMGHKQPGLWGLRPRDRRRSLPAPSASLVPAQAFSQQAQALVSRGRQGRPWTSSWPPDPYLGLVPALPSWGGLAAGRLPGR